MERKFGYADLLEKMGVTRFPDEGDDKALLMVIARSSVFAVVINMLGTVVW